MIAPNAYRVMLEEIDEKGEGLTGWELGYVTQLIDSNQQSFSPKQETIIDRIYAERMP